MHANNTMRRTTIIATMATITPIIIPVGEVDCGRCFVVGFTNSVV